MLNLNYGQIDNHVKTSESQSLRVNGVFKTLDVYKALDVIVKSYSLLKKSLDTIDINDVKDYLEKTGDERRAYTKDGFKIKFYNGDFNKEQENCFLEILKEIQNEKIKIRLMGGSVYKLHGGKGDTPDLDYELLMSKEGEEAAKICGLGDGVEWGWLFESDKKEFLFSDEAGVPYPFDNHGIINIDQESLNTKYAKVIGTEAVEVYAQTKDAFIDEQESVIQAYEKAPVLNTQGRDRLEKMKCRVNELKGIS